MFCSIDKSLGIIQGAKFDHSFFQDEPDAKQQADKKPPWDKSNGNGNKNGSESPKVGRRCEDNPTHKYSTHNISTLTNESIAPKSHRIVALSVRSQTNCIMILNYT